jgi:hypothetical protein
MRLSGVGSVRAIGIGLHGGMKSQLLLHLGVELAPAADEVDAAPQLTQLYPALR